MSMTNLLLYKNFFITGGIGEDNHQKLLAFDKALMMAGINQCNLVLVSSMLPHGAKLISKSRAEILTGEIVFCVMARNDGRKGESIYSGIGYATGYDKESNKEYGFVLEGSNKLGESGLRKELISGLKIMAELRNFEIQHCDVITRGIKKIKSSFGSAIVSLIYRP